MIICELQSKHFIVGVGSFEHMQNTFKETGQAMAGGVNPLLSGARSPPAEGPSVDFTLCASSL